MQQLMRRSKLGMHDFQALSHLREEVSAWNAGEEPDRQTSRTPRAYVRAFQIRYRRIPKRDCASLGEPSQRCSPKPPATPHISSPWGTWLLQRRAYPLYTHTIATKCSLHKLKLVKHIRLVTLVAAKAGTGHLLLHARVVLFRSSFLITAHCVAADVCEAGVERCFGLFGVLRVGLGVASQSHNTRKTTVRELHTLIIPQT